MKQVQIFSAADVLTLQYRVNEWLTTNKHIEVIETNMTSFGTPEGDKNQGGEKHTFYILYSTTLHPVAEAAAILEQALPTTKEMPDMNTDILPHAN